MKVGDQFRKNKLSLAPGGSTITVILKSGKVLEYDKVKNVEAYCNHLVKSGNIKTIKVGNEIIWNSND
jgi:hypothetical protein